MAGVPRFRCGVPRVDFSLDRECDAAFVRNGGDGILAVGLGWGLRPRCELFQELMKNELLNCVKEEHERRVVRKVRFPAQSALKEALPLLTSTGGVPPSHWESGWGFDRRPRFGIRQM